MDSDSTTTTPGNPEDATRTVNMADASSSEVKRGAVPDRIGSYRILRLIGEGGMGAVYEAEQEQPRRIVALKVIKSSWASPGMLRRFEQESQALARLQHPGIAQVYEAGTADSASGPQPYFAMEFDTQATRQTDIGQLVGTLAYMSPEQALADPLELDIRSDVYALGVILYELLAGKLPYQLSHKLHEAVVTIREQDPSALSMVSRVYRGDIETIVAKALEKDKTRRYASGCRLGRGHSTPSQGRADRGAPVEHDVSAREVRPASQNPGSGPHCGIPGVGNRRDGEHEGGRTCHPRRETRLEPPDTNRAGPCGCRTAEQSGTAGPPDSGFPNA